MVMENLYQQIWINIILSLIVVRGILDVCAHYCRTVVNNKYVDAKQSVYSLLWMETAPLKPIKSMFNSFMINEYLDYNDNVIWKLLQLISQHVKRYT